MYGGSEVRRGVGKWLMSEDRIGVQTYGSEVRGCLGMWPVWSDVE